MLTIGADPELQLVRGAYNLYAESCRYDSSVLRYTQMGLDGCPQTAEVRPRYGKTAAEFSRHVKTLMQGLLLGAQAEGIQVMAGGYPRRAADRKSTRLNSSHLGISY